MAIGISAVWADTRQAGDISVSIQPGFSGTSGHGARQVDFVVTNRSAQPRNINLINEAGRNYSYMPNLKQILINAKVPANANIKIPVFTPCVNIPESQLRLYVDGSARKIEPPLKEKLNYYSSYNSGTAVLSVRGAILAKADKSGRYTTDNFIFNTCGIPVSDWSEYPQAYSRFDLVAITDDSLNEMSPDIKKALLRYAELGGVLFIQGNGSDFNIPSPWKKSFKEDKKLKIWEVGYGLVVVCPQEKKLVEAAWERLKGMCGPVRKRLNDETRRKAADVDRKYPIISEIQLSPTVLLVILIIFSIIIGPVNILYLTKKKKKLLLLLTVPAISIVFTIAIFAYSFLAEGWHARSRYDTVTLLDQQKRSCHQLRIPGVLLPDSAVSRIKVFQRDYPQFPKSVA